MPNQTFVTSNGTRTRASDSVVIGRVISAEIKSSHGVVGESIVDLPPGSSEAMWSMAAVELDVEEAWGDLVGEEPATFVLPIRGEDAERQLASIRSLGRIVVFLLDGRVARNEALLGLVTDDDQITFPVAIGAKGSDVNDERFFEGIDTVAELRAALTQGSRSDIQLNERGARVSG